MLSPRSHEAAERPQNILRHASFPGISNDATRHGDGDENGKDTIYGDGYNSYAEYQAQKPVTTAVGDDTIYSGRGNDIVFGDNGTVNLSTGEGPGSGGKDLIFAGSGNDTVYGEGGNDEIHGEDGNDRLFGGSGNDTLFGEKGNDVISGGSGDDIIVVGRAPTS